MSLILDALNRSQQERRKPGEIPPPTPLSHPDQARGVPAWRRWLPWVALGLALLVIAGLLWERGTGGEPEGGAAPAPPVIPPRSAASGPAAREPVPARPVATEVVAPAPAAPRAAAPQSATPQSATPQSAAPQPATPQPATPQPATPQPAAPERPRRQEPRQSASDQAALEALYGTAPESREAPTAASAPSQPATPQPAAETRTEEPVDLEKMLELARRELGNQQLVEHPAPFLMSLSQQTRDAIPTLMYSGHDWAGDSASSSVIINGGRHRVGEQVASGVRVAEILPDSVVLEFRGKKFRLKALNSWVNL